MDLSTLRNEIDRIDSQLVQLYEQRMEICSQVAEYKIENGKKVFDKTREEEKLARVRSLTHNDFNSQGVTELFEQIMAMSRKLQYQMLESHGRTSRLPFIPVENLDTKKARVVFQGAEGAYSQAAMMRFFGERIDSIHVDSFRDAMSAIEEGSAEFAVLPIENSTAGIVSEIYDLLVEFENLDTKKARVVFQGAEGAYSQAAMMRFFGERIDSIHVDSFRDAMSAIEEGSAEFAVLPIENSTAGIVSEIYDLLVEFENYIVGEQILKIEHCLLGVPGTKISDIQTVYSHPQSLMQSSRFLGGHSWQQISMPNNAFAARKVAEDRLKTQAAIASEYAGKVYGLEVLQKPVNNVSNNSTRFIIVTNQKIFKKNAKKISICFEVPHESGSLYHMLSHFIYNHLNLTKIESRPIEGRTWEYRFFLDFEGNLEDSAVKNALRGLREEASNMKILGNY